MSMCGCGFCFAASIEIWEKNMDLILNLLTTYVILTAALLESRSFVYEGKESEKIA